MWKLEDLVVQFVELQTKSQVLALNDAVEAANKERVCAQNRLTQCSSDHIVALRMTKHMSILETHGNVPLVYLSLLEVLDGDCGDVYKIGSTNNINERTSSLQRKFGACTHVYVIVARLHTMFEKFLQKHTNVACHRYTELINGKSKSTETFRLTSNMVDKVKSLMKREVIRYNGFSAEEEIRCREIAVSESVASTREREVANTTSQIHLDERRFALANEFKVHVLDLYQAVKECESDLVLHPHLKSLQDRYAAAQSSYQDAYAHYASFASADDKGVDDTTSHQVESINMTTAQRVAEETRCAHLRHRQVTRGNIVQRYNSELQLIDHFDGPTDAARAVAGEHATETASAQAITKAIQNNTEYKDFRWAEVPRNHDPTTPQSLMPTVHTQKAGGGRIAIYARDGKSIETVTPDQRAAGKYLQVKAAAAISLAVNSGLTRKCQGCLLSNWCDVPQTLQTSYLESHELPPLPERRGLKVLQLDATTEDIVRRWDNVSMVTKQFRMSTESVKSACNNNEARAGFLWRWHTDLHSDGLQ